MQSSAVREARRRRSPLREGRKEDSCSRRPRLGDNWMELPPSVPRLPVGKI